MAKVVKPKNIKNKSRVAIIVSQWNELVTKQLLEGAVSELEDQEQVSAEIFHVPGTWEIPVVAASIARSEKPVAAIVALGCILQGQTTHGTLLSSDVSSALMRLQVETGIPIAYGVLTPETMEQALDRAGMKHGNKGREAAQAALKMISIKEQL